MSVISILITESDEQRVAGIPKNIKIDTNIPATIFYTLDNSIPSTSSSVYTGPINLPTNNSSVTVKIFASNGIDSTSIITQTFAPSLVGARLSHATIKGLSQIGPSGNNDMFPFGDNGNSGGVIYGPVVGKAIDSANIANIPGDFDGSGTGTYANGSDFPMTEYKQIFSTTNNLGEVKRNVGTLPGKVTVKKNKEIPQSSNTNKSLFNPKALVIYQDSRDPIPDNISQLNRPFFSLEDIQKKDSGVNFGKIAFESSVVTGNFIRQFFNPKDNTITYYYRDSSSNRWIISTEPFSAKNPNIGNLSTIVTRGRSSADRFVYKWIPFSKRYIG